MIIEREPEIVVRVPLALRCSNPWCDKATRCPGEPCKKCRHEQEVARAAFRKILEQHA